MSQVLYSALAIFFEDLIHSLMGFEVEDLMHVLSIHFLHPIMVETNQNDK
jgi:hypothetical protein